MTGSQRGRGSKHPLYFAIVIQIYNILIRFWKVRGLYFNNLPKNDKFAKIQIFIANLIINLKFRKKLVQIAIQFQTFKT